ncbi:hypothetical protein UG46_10125 [Pseudomonas fluorescens]|nr:hypothetical protein UG46_10125 [Pseudomonas fluorescens]
MPEYVQLQVMHQLAVTGKQAADDLNFRADYSLTVTLGGRCALAMVSCKCLTKDGIQSLPCHSPNGCSLVQGNACKPYGRLNVVVVHVEDRRAWLWGDLPRRRNSSGREASRSSEIACR